MLENWVGQGQDFVGSILGAAAGPHIWPQKQLDSHLGAVPSGQEHLQRMPARLQSFCAAYKDFRTVRGCQ
jgi:hypothetical protein